MVRSNVCSYPSASLFLFSNVRTGLFSPQLLSSSFLQALANDGSVMFSIHLAWPQCMVYRTCVPNVPPFVALKSSFIASAAKYMVL